MLYSISYTAYFQLQCRQCVQQYVVNEQFTLKEHVETHCSCF